ncbi:prepilin-type N-terminal cleavage/methylation domain-containing protein [Eubacterium pyruvativorans]|uniref:Prepilin-type N-terminal cleavage/methylation domain-containing protein n=1 Tax=Eubacterium pyruvativorans TaxID=155865 RepID=A0A1I7I2D2_9FIRM|nr:prepilin-type N-terminal cleavage/methylation domain-containing protein [Eubacterium pyruvativorans]SFO36815.1 prepilin-type N-terminal cleavage/methylation domain-containing protein [Eubacterium pyruvativorans]SFU67084.1 prepilin-type N-terminal cleavage/methylation domain-containing protein [Eubacterium pyruvativorans]
MPNDYNTTNASIIPNADAAANAYNTPNDSAIPNANAAPDRTCGFTLAELLVVVAIIAVLVMVSIPIFTAQLEKSREAVDLSNLRSAYGAGKYQLMEEDEKETGSSPETYIYDPGSGKLLTVTEAGKSGSATLFCGKGTARIGSSHHTQSIRWDGETISRYSAANKKLLVSGSGGMLYDPAMDVSERCAIMVTIHQPTKTVIAYFQKW